MKSIVKKHNQTPSWLFEILRDPATGNTLETHQIATQCNMISLVHPPALGGEDKKMNRFYDRIAPFYTFFERVLGRIIAGICVEQERQNVISLLDIPKGSRLLEVSPGPGVFQQALRDAVGAEGQIVSVDLSLNMLRQCQKQSSRLSVELIQGNAQHLPFADESFDVLFHFGGINLFNDPNKALAEFIRVVRRGGLIAWGDERMSDQFQHPIRRFLLRRMNPGYCKQMPPIPAQLQQVCIHQAYKGLAYLVTAKKAVSTK